MQSLIMIIVQLDYLLGLGVSWASPFGPISVIISEALLKEAYDVTESVSFGIGTTF